MLSLDTFIVILHYMPNPTKKNTKTSQRDRRSHHGATKVLVLKDKDGNLHLPHNVSPASGKYRGKEVTDPKKRVTRRERKVKAQ